jgi:hypothetical protein
MVVCNLVVARGNIPTGLEWGWDHYDLGQLTADEFAAIMEDYKAFEAEFSKVFKWTLPELVVYTDEDWYCLDYDSEVLVQTYVSQTSKLSWAQRQEVIDDMIAYQIHRFGLYNGMQAYSAASAICDMINDFICVYDFSYTFNSAYSGLTCGMSCCVGQSEIFKNVCEYVGVDCEIVYGTFDGYAHAWNRVTFSDGTVRYIDVTNSHTGRFTMVTEEWLRQSHDW